MSLNSLGLGFLFTAQDLASGVMDKVGKSLKGLEDQSGRSIGNIDQMTGKLGAGLTAAAIGVGGLAASYGLASKAGEFESALAAVGAVSNATTAELKLLRAAAMQAGKDTQYSPTQAIQGMNELAQSGFNAKEQIELLNPVLALAAGSLGDLSPQEAAGLASQALKAFGIDASLAGRAVDQMLQASNAFAVRASDLPLGLGTASRGAQVLNQSLTETVIAFGLVKNVVPGTERAATAVASAMERMAKPEVQKALKAQKVAVVDAQGGYRQFLDIIKDLMPALDKMSEGDRGSFLVETFGADALGSINAIMSQFQTGIKGADGTLRKGGEAIDYLRDQFRGANGVAEDFSKKMLDTYEGSKVLMTGSMETLAISLGDPFKDVLRPAIDAATAALNGMISVLEDLSPEMKQMGAAIIVGAFALLTLVGGFLALSAAWPLIAGGLSLASGALAGLAASALSALAAMWPLLLIGAGIAAIAYAIENNVGGMGDTWDRVVEAFRGGGAVLGNIFDKVMAYVTPLWDALVGGFSSVWEMLDPVFARLSDAFGMLMDALGSIGDQFDSTTSGPGAGMVGFFRILGNVIGWLVGVFVTLITWMVYFYTSVVSVISGVVSVVKPLIQGLFDAISFWVEKIMWLIDSVVGAVKGVWGMLDDPNEAKGRTNTRGMGGAAGKSPAQPTAPPAGAPPALPAGPDNSIQDRMPAAAAVAAKLKARAEQGDAGAQMQYEKLAAMIADSLAKRPVDVSIDGEKVARAVERSQRSSAARRSGADMQEE